jgi:hypothetical protein
VAERLRAPDGYPEQATPFSKEEQLLADMVALVATDGSHILVGSNSSDSAQRAARQADRLAEELASSADAALLAAAFHYNRYAASSADSEARSESLRRAQALVERAVGIDAKFSTSPFVKLLRRAGAPASGSNEPVGKSNVRVHYESRADVRGLGYALIIGGLAAGTLVLVNSLSPDCDSAGCSGPNVAGAIVGPLLMLGGTWGGLALVAVPNRRVVEPVGTTAAASPALAGAGVVYQAAF